MAASIDMTGSGGIGAAPKRLAGALAATTVVGNSASARERIKVQGQASITVLAKCSAVTSDPVLDIVPQLATVTDDDSVTGDTVTSGTTPLTLSTSEQALTYTIRGERYVDIVVTSDSGDSATISYVDVFVKPIR